MINHDDIEKEDIIEFKLHGVSYSGTVGTVIRGSRMVGATPVELENQYRVLFIEPPYYDNETLIVSESLVTGYRKTKKIADTVGELRIL